MSYIAQIEAAVLKIKITGLSFPRKWESMLLKGVWIPVFKGMTPVARLLRTPICVKVIGLIFIFFTSVFSQQINFQSPQNIKLFADFLFCDKDYLRAIDEYEKYLITNSDDSVQFRIAFCYSLMNDQTHAMQKFDLINCSSPMYELSRMEKLKSLFLQNIDSAFVLSSTELINSKSQFSNDAQKLLNTSILLTVKELPDRNKFLIPFENEEKSILNNFYDLKNNPPYKSTAIAGIFSAIIPGAGKIYTENYGDGITAFVLTGLFGYLAYTNFNHDHPTRAWIFTALGAGFYIGNIYGSVASAQIFNAKINFEFDEGVKLFLEEKNYFVPAYEFCK
jgi:TM2 domain-containing membrane protein YozV